jgi:hypothetical protein
MDRPDMHLRPFRLSTIRLNAEDSFLMEEGVVERLAGRIWEELTPEQTRSAKYVSREFAARDAYGAGRSVGDFSHLSDHYYAVLTKSETLESFSVSMRRHDTMLSMDLCSGCNPFRLHRAMTEYLVDSVKLMDGTVRYFRYLVLLFDWYRSGYWFTRLVSRFWTTIKARFGYRVLSYVDDYIIRPSTGRPLDKDGLTTSLSPFGQAVIATRIRQIETRAMRRLRHPNFRRAVMEYASGYCYRRGLVANSTSVESHDLTNNQLWVKCNGFNISDISNHESSANHSRSHK